MIVPKKISTTSKEWIGPLPSRPLKMALSAYRVVNNSGFLYSRLGSQLFSKVYFTYKSLFGDNFKALVKSHPELFAGGHIIDVGANIGYTSSLFNTVLSKGYKIFAFEPEQKNFTELERFIKKYNLSKRITPIQSALGETSRKTKLWKNPTSHADHRIVDESTISLENDQMVQEVSMLSLDDFLEMQNLQNELIAFIKIDIQGYEGPAIQGMQKTLQKNPQATLVFEYSPYTMKQLGFVPEELLHSLEKQGFHMQLLNADGTFSPFDAKNKSGGEFGEYYDIVCTKN